MLETDAVRGEMEKLGVIPIKADYTRKSPAIKAWLDRFRRGGVPMYVVIPADRSRDMWVLSELLTTGTVVDALRDAAGTVVGVTGE